MKIEYYCCIDTDKSLLDILDYNGISYEINKYPDDEWCTFTVYSDMPVTEDILRYIKGKKGTTIHETDIFSDEEMEKAKWYLFYVTRMGIDTKNPDFTYEYSCLYYVSPEYGFEKYHHCEQINPFVTSKTPKWKTKYHFCSTETGEITKIFCSDYAKDIIIQNGIKGVEFIPVLKGDLVTHTENVNQLTFPNKLPFEAFTFIGKYKEIVCPFCGKKKYMFDRIRGDNIRIKTEMIPEGIDAFCGDLTIGEGFGYHPIVISKKFYNLLTTNFNKKHMLFNPIAF